MAQLNWLKRHPFPVVADFDRVVALSFAFPVHALRPLVPAGLEIDAYEGHGFLTIAMVWTRHLRPAGFPRFLGRDFFLAGYRVFTRFQGADGRRLRGLKILRSDTDKRSMVALGNLMTGYRYQHVSTQIDTTADAIRVRTFQRDGVTSLDVALDVASEAPGLPAGSPFPDWRSARRFAGPMPFTFSPRGDGSFVVIEGGRESWSPRPIAVKNWHVEWFREGALADYTPILANAFTVENISYRWERGRIFHPLQTP